jgi:hypothetical protein
LAAFFDAALVFIGPTRATPAAVFDCAHIRGALPPKTNSTPTKITAAHRRRLDAIFMIRSSVDRPGKV